MTVHIESECINRWYLCSTNDYKNHNDIVFNYDNSWFTNGTEMTELISIDLNAKQNQPYLHIHEVNKNMHSNL